MKKLILLLMVGSLFAQIKAKLIAKNFDKPLYITNYPGYNNQLLVVQQDGIIRIIEDNKVQITQFLDISERTHQPLYPADEMGMLGFTFHPQFNENKYFYVNYVDKDNLDLIDHTNELLESMNKNEFYLSSFGEDQEGELFIVNYSGEVYSITK